MGIPACLVVIAKILRKERENRLIFSPSQAGLFLEKEVIELYGEMEKPIGPRVPLFVFMKRFYNSIPLPSPWKKSPAQVKTKEKWKCLK